MRILLATDGSDSSEAAFSVVQSRPWPADTVVLVLSVVQPPLPMVDPTTALAPIQFETVASQLTEATRRSVNRSAERLRDHLAVETAIRTGDPRLEIVQAAEDWKADLIVLGSHGRTGVSRWLLGSVAEYVVRHAPCSVEVARERKP